MQNKTLSGVAASKRVVYALIFTMVFEGVIRKLVPLTVGTIIFFIKDLLCIYGMFIVLNMRLDKLTNNLASIWRKVFIAFFPLILYAFVLDPPLGLFGTKQYLLYVVVGLLISVAFDNDEKGLKQFFLITASLLIPTTIIAIIQNGLPATHWLNQGVGGGDLAAFSAAGYLRVSSTFSFTGQYSFFLNIASAFYAASLFMQPKFKNASKKVYLTLYLLFLGLMLIIGAFITGGRTAVLGCGACLLLGFLFTGWRYPGWFLTKGLIGFVLAAFALSTIRVAKPEFFEAYETRSAGSEEQTHSAEVEGRLIGSFLGTGWLFQEDVSTIIVGQGIGVMTNGSTQLSSYASRMRSSGFWTESDVASTLWEGGIYLAVIWYSLRLYMIYYCYRNWKSIKKKEYASAASFFLAYTLVLGIFGTLGIQSPISIYWWMSIGCTIILRKLDASLQQQAIVIKPSNSILEDAIVQSGAMKVFNKNIKS